MGKDLATSLTTDLATDLANDLAGGAEAPAALGAYAWLRSDSVALNGSDVQSWIGKLNSRDAVAPSATEEAAYTASDSSWNNQPSALFDGLANYYEADWLSDLTDGGAAYTIIAVHGVTASGQRSLWSAVGDNANYARSGVVAGFPFVWHRAGGTQDFDQSGAAISGNTWTAYTSDGATNGVVYNEGSSNFTWDTLYQSSSTSHGAIGSADLSTPTDFWNDDLLEVIAFDRDLTAGELAQIGTYLQGRYAQW